MYRRRAPPGRSRTDACISISIVESQAYDYNDFSVPQLMLALKAQMNGIGAWFFIVGLPVLGNDTRLPMQSSMANLYTTIINELIRIRSFPLSSISFLRASGGAGISKRPTICAIEIHSSP